MENPKKSEELLVKKTKFILSAFSKRQFPEDEKSQIAFVGRSNCGKSSLINYLVNQKKLAKTSQTPGKTRSVNFFLINEEFYFVDLPGYGFAKLSKKLKAEWKQLLIDYLGGNRSLMGVVLILDSRRIPSPEDIMMCDWLKHFGIHIIIALSKTDKLSSLQVSKNRKIIMKSLDLKDGEIPVFEYSALKKRGREKLNRHIFQIFNANTIIEKIKMFDN